MDEHPSVAGEVFDGPRCGVISPTGAACTCPSGHSGPHVARYGRERWSSVAGEPGAREPVSGDLAQASRVMRMAATAAEEHGCDVTAAPSTTRALADALDELASLRAERNRLRRALLDYGQHMPSCRIGSRADYHPQATFGAPCSCGFDEARWAAYGYDEIGK